MTERQKKELRDRIGRRIAEARTRSEMTLEVLSEKSGIQAAHIERIEKGKYTPPLEVLESIAKALGMKVDIV